jgi:tRNA G18 (ribose-2'-O)-methylase SpoU
VCGYGYEGMAFQRNLKLIKNKLSIPRFGEIQKTESLNVATATAIILSEFKVVLMSTNER